MSDEITEDEMNELRALHRLIVRGGGVGGFDKLLSGINKAQLEGSRPLSGRACRLHDDLVLKIKANSPVDVSHLVPTKVLCRPHLYTTATTANVRGKKVILVIAGVGSLDKRSRSYTGFCEDNEGSNFSVTDWFSHVVSHEYGHILEDVFLDEGEIGKSWINNGLSYSEGFAFWFNDAITGFRTNIDDVAHSYSTDSKLIISDALTSTYHALIRYSSKKGVAKTLKDATKIIKKVARG